MRLSLIIVLLLACMAHASPVYAAPSIETVAPGIGQRGTEFTLTLVGAGLSDQAEIVLYAPGVTCTGVKAANENELTATLKAEGDCPLGTHPFRVRTSQGLSELRIFRISPLTVLAAAEPNESPKQAMPITGNVTITGVLEAADTDCFEIMLHKGESLSAEVEAVRLGQMLLDTVLTVYGPDGKVLVEVDDTCLFGQDPFVSIVAAVDGKHVVHVREAANEGDANSRYALHLGKFPRPAFAYPAGGPAGQAVAIRFHGDARGLIEQTIILPAVPPNAYGVLAEHAGIATPTAIPFRVSPYANVLEIEPNDDLAMVAATAAELPVAFNGILEKRRDIDRFRFRMTAGQTIQFEAFAQRLGSRADTLISILDTTGTVLVRNDDDGSHDSRLVFQAPYTGEFQLHVIDKRGSGDLDFFYRIEAAPVQPELIAFLPRPNRLSQERQTISVPRGNRVMSFVAVRRQGIKAPVTVDLQSLPTGVSAPSMTVPSDQFLVPVVFEAAADAPLGGALAATVATVDAHGSKITGGFQQIVDLVAGPADALYQSVTVDRLAVAVIEPASFSIRLDEPKSGLSQDGTLSLTVHVDRAADFAGPVDVTFPNLPPWVDGPVKLTIPANRTSGVYVVHAFPQAQPRAWPICAEGRPGTETLADLTDLERPIGAPPPSRGRRRGRAKVDAVVSTQLVTLNIVSSPVTGVIGRVAAEQGTKLKLIAAVDRRELLPETLIATLEGLPNRVNSKPITMVATGKQVEFLVEFEPTAPLGSFSSLVCRLTGQVDGQEVSYCIGRGGVLKIEPSGALVTDQTGRPLSPLEVLRKNQQKGSR